jgi:hypothetical protein
VTLLAQPTHRVLFAKSMMTSRRYRAYVHSYHFGLEGALRSALVARRDYGRLVWIEGTTSATKVSVRRWR